MRKIENKITTYELNNGFYLDIEETSVELSAYIYEPRSSVKMFCIGVARHQKPIGEPEFDESASTLIDWVIEELDMYIMEYYDMIDDLETANESKLEGV